MTNSEIKKLINNYFNDIISDNFILKKDILIEYPINDLVIGFCFEKSSNKNGLYIWSFVQPLYVPDDSITLSFGKRLGNKFWVLNDDKFDQNIEELRSLMKVEIDSFFPQINSPYKFYNYYKDKSLNLRMHETIVYSAVYSGHQDLELIVNNYIQRFRSENLSIEWVNDILSQMEYLRSILNNKDELNVFFESNKLFTKNNLNL